MKFNDSLKLKIGVYALIAILGLAILFAGFRFSGANKEYLLFTGAGLFFVGALKCVRYAKALASPQKLEELETQFLDERVQFPAYKAGYFAFVLSLLAMYGYSLYLLLQGSALFSPLSYICSFLLCIYLVSYLVVKKIN